MGEDIWGVGEKTTWKSTIWSVFFPPTHTNVTANQIPAQPRHSQSDYCSAVTSEALGQSGADFFSTDTQTDGQTDIRDLIYRLFN